MPTLKPSCPVCSSTRTTLWKSRNLDRELTPEDFRITDSRYGVTLTLHKCEDCSFLFADPSETAHLTALYEQLVDPSYEEGAENRALQMRWLLRLGKAIRPQARTLLEIGAGSGLLVSEAGHMGLQAVGVEPSNSLVATAKKSRGVDLIQGIYPHPQLAGRRFDLVYLIDVIEHVEDPVQLLADCASALAPGGVFLVVTPDVSSMAAKLLGRRWWHFRLAHVGYFNRRSMSEACRRAGLTIESSRRIRWFFPIRYLAERASLYLPVGPLNRLAERVPPFAWLYDRVIPVNLRDSTAFFMTRI